VIQNTRRYTACPRKVPSSILTCEVIHPIDGIVTCFIVYSDHKTNAWASCSLCRGVCTVYNVLHYVIHHQFNIQQLYALPTLYLCVLYLSENKQRLVPLTA